MIGIISNTEQDTANEDLAIADMDVTQNLDGVPPPPPMFPPPKKLWYLYTSIKN